MTRTIAYPMLEPASMLCIIGAFWMVVTRNLAGFLIVAALAVATKEVLAVCGLLWLAHHAQRRDLARLALDVAIATWPALVFLSIRCALGGDLTSHDGVDVGHGQLPDFAARVLTWSGLGAVLVSVPVLLAACFLSHQVTRVLGILYPIVSPAFLLATRDSLSPSVEFAGSRDTDVRLRP